MGRSGQDEWDEKRNLTEYECDLAGKRTAVIRYLDGRALRHSFTYYDNGELHTVTDQHDTTTYTYDSLNRLETVTDAQGITRYTYDDVGNLDMLTYPNGIVLDYDYNSVNQLDLLTTRAANGSIIQSYDYTLDDTGRRRAILEANGRHTQYGFDNLYRLTSETITDAVNGNYSASYQYDWVGNRLYSIIQGVHTSYAYDDNDRLESQGGTLYGYDNNGNLTSETLDGNATVYSYDHKNKLILLEQNGFETARYTYNHSGIRTGKTENGQTTTFVVDSNRDYAQVLLETDGTSQIHYSYGHDLIQQTRGGQASFYLYDGLGSTRALADAAGAITDRYDYEAFGEALNRVGDTENHYQFTGEQFDTSLNQYYLRARYYDQGVGRFGSMDSYLGRDQEPVTLHKYLYANSDPVNFTDPTDNFSLGSIGAGLNIQGILSMVSIANSAYDVFQIATGEEEFSARQFATNILLSRLPVGVVTKLLKKHKVKTGKDLTIPCARNSFMAGTLIHTSEGLKPIEEIVIGDLVLSYNESTGEQEYQEVIHLIQHENDYQLVKY